MEDERFIWLFMGGFGLLCALGLAFVKVDRESLRERSHSYPQMALFRFPLWRWVIVIFCALFGLFFLTAGLGLVQL